MRKRDMSIRCLLCTIATIGSVITAFAQINIVDGSLGGIRDKSGDVNVEIGGYFTGGRIQYATSVYVSYEKSVPAGQMSVYYTLTTQKDTDGKQTFMHVGNNMSELEQNRAVIAVSGTATLTANDGTKKTAELCELILPKDARIVSGWLIAKDSSFPRARLAAYPTIKTQSTSSDAPGQPVNSTDIFSVFKIQNDFTLEPVQPTDIRRKHEPAKTKVSGSSVKASPRVTSAPPIRVEVNGKQLRCSAPPIQSDGRTLVPLRDIFEALGASVAWDASSKGITANRDGTEVRLTVGGRRATVDGRPVALDAPAKVVRGVTMVPLRFVGEALGTAVSWNAETRTVSITTGEAAS